VNGPTIAFIASLIGTVVVVVALFFVRRLFSSRGWRDFLGLAMTFVALLELTFVMIFIENQIPT